MMLSVLTYSVKAFVNVAVKSIVLVLVEHFKFVLTACILCQSNKKCVNCIAYTNRCCAKSDKSLGKLLKVLKKNVIAIVKKL